MEFVHLHVHNEYSFLDGFGPAKNYCKKAAELGFKQVALTNHGNVDGCVKWQEACKENGLKSILGVEMYIVPDLSVKEKGEKRHHITLLAMSMKGWRSRNAMNDAGQASAINTINEEETIYNSASGQSINVEAGSNRYFTNGSNEYIRTDDYLYNPNMDNSVNQYQWQEWKGN